MPARRVTSTPIVARSVIVHAYVDDCSRARGMNESSGERALSETLAGSSQDPDAVFSLLIRDYL